MSIRSPGGVSARTAAATVGGVSRLDVLINNAGVAKFRRELTPAGIGVTFATSHSGPFLLTNLLLDLRMQSAHARVITVPPIAPTVR